jgi:hypothetical protein
MPEQETPFDIIGGTEKSEYPEFNPDLTVNMFQVLDNTAFFKKALFPTPGLSQKTGQTFQLGGENLGGRNAHLFKDAIYAVFKDTIYRIIGNIIDNKLKLTHSVIGRIETETGHVGIENNNTQVVFVDGIGGWVYDTITGNFTKITDPNFPAGASDITLLANRFVVNKGESNISHYSSLGDGLSWTDPGFGNFFSLDSYADVIVGYETINGKMLIFGNNSTELFYAAGGSVFPFRPQKPTLEFGCAAVGSIAKAFGMLGWLSQTKNGIGAIVVTTGGTPVSISNDALNNEIDSYDDVSDATAYFYRNEIGHIMYVINFTIANASWMYDFNTKAWSKLTSEGDNRHWANGHVYYKSRHFVLDYKSPIMYEMSKNFYDDNGIGIKRQRIFQLDKLVLELTYYHQTPLVILGAIGNITRAAFFKVILNFIRFYLKQGVGGAEGNDTDPVIKLRCSSDGGISYENEIPAEIGKLGERMWQTEFHKVGGLSL